MTTASEFHSQLVDLASDPAVAGLSLTGGYESLTGSTVTPPAGTIRQDGRVVGIFITADGAQAATIDSWGSVSSRCEALLAGRFGDGTLADYLNFPLVTFVDESDQVITTSVELSHRQADTTWRLARDELRKAPDRLPDGNSLRLVALADQALPEGGRQGQQEVFLQREEQRDRERARRVPRLLRHESCGLPFCAPVHRRVHCDGCRGAAPHGR